jgi:hypothetical protein
MLMRELSRKGGRASRRGVRVYAVRERWVMPYGTMAMGEQMNKRRVGWRLISFSSMSL